MAAHAVGSCTISFGLVSIPVKVYSASQASATISFNMLHKTCGSRLKQQYICTKDGEKVERNETAKGYEFAKGQYVVFSEEELKAIEEKATQTIEIVEFVPAAKVDPIYYDKPYYLGPEKGGDRAYKLLARAMIDSGRFAIATYSARGRTYLVLLRPSQGGLVMQQLHYADEIKPMSEIGFVDVDVKEAELQLAMMLMSQVSSDTFQPEKYKDESRAKLQALIQRKIEGQDITQSVEEPKTQIIDLMEALKASLAKKDAAPSGAEAPPAEERKPALRVVGPDETAEAATAGGRKKRARG